MTLDSSGNLGIGTSSPNARLHVVGEIYAAQASANSQQIRLTPQATDSNIIYSTYSGTNSYLALAFNVGGSERSRIDTSGNLLVGTTSVLTYGKLSIAYSGTPNYGLTIKETTDASSTVFALFSNSSNVSCGSISRVALTNAVAYNTTSDYRLKTVTGAVTGQGARLDALKPVNYLWIEGGQQARGFLAHEFQQVYANSVNGTKDAVDENGNPKYQSMQAGSSEVIADLVAEIQSLRQRLSAANL
jgi:hypothetical protein